MARNAEIIRNTKETRICLTLDLDGAGAARVHTGIGFFDHMLESFARHGFFDLKLEVEGDLEVDTHHTIEDVGIVLGTAIKEFLYHLCLQISYKLPVKGQIIRQIRTAAQI